ncbi:hypothetical protein KFK09_000893 [Dendrobium nobile]|uniref:NPH3 domain-containing protein n=1 Tax=Dendrobium nobile TaxID=94219 RepID=A0A8T3CG84_DENNO|nr:hypothetical protein KFK09_000893 [Dendrobium nobile]
MYCRRSAVDDVRSRRSRAVDEDRRRIRWAVDEDRHRRRWACDDDRRRRRREIDDYPPLELPLQWRDPPPVYPSPFYSAARKGIPNQPIVVDDYPPLELPLRWRDPPPEYPPLLLPLPVPLPQLTDPISSGAPASSDPVDSSHRSSGDRDNPDPLKVQFPLISKCGFIKKLLSEPNDKTSSIDLPDIPGGSEAFQLADKFCYGINFEINTENIAVFRCASEFLEMTEEVSTGNLLSRTEAYLEEVVLISLSGSVTVLHKSVELLPMAEKVKLVSRCIDAIAYLACSNSQFSTSSKGDSSHENSSSSVSQPRAIMDWWAEELIVLRIDTFQRVLMALKSRGFKQQALGPVIMLYAQNSLRGLDIFGRGRQKIEPKQEHEKKVVLETIVSLLPTETNTISVSFLSMLLRAALYLETTVACRLDLEKRISLQLTHAALDDLLIPSFSFNGDILFDIDTIQRIFINYLQHENDISRLGYNTDEDYLSPPHGDIERVGRLMESYLAEIALDPNLGIAKFVSFAELIPEQAKVTEDDMYIAIDIYLKAHQLLTEAERKIVPTHKIILGAYGDFSIISSSEIMNSKSNKVDDSHGTVRIGYLSSFDENEHKVHHVDWKTSRHVVISKSAFKVFDPGICCHRTSPPIIEPRTESSSFYARGE